jgi:hypothetical protein
MNCTCKQINSKYDIGKECVLCGGIIVPITVNGTTAHINKQLESESRLIVRIEAPGFLKWYDYKTGEELINMLGSGVIL